MVSRSRMIAKRVQGDIDEEAPTPQRKANGMSFCIARAMWAAQGQLRVVTIQNSGGVPGTCSKLHPIVTSLPIAREDQVARWIPAKRGTVALSKHLKHWVPRASGRLAHRRACVNS